MAGKGGSKGGDGQDELGSLTERLASLEKSMSTLLMRFGEQEQELLNLSQIVMGMQGDAGSPTVAPAAVEPTPAAQRSPLSPAMGNVLKLIHSGLAEEAKQALAAIPAEERRAQPAVLAIAAAALCIARDDYANARTALSKARQLTDDARLLRIVELVAAKIPAA